MNSAPDAPAANQADLGVGLIGTGFMGRAHALAWGTATRVFDLPIQPRLVSVADIAEAQAVAAAKRWGFAGSTTDWRELVADPTINVISITAPNSLHHEIALATIAAGKHVYCEKPLAPNAEQAAEMRDAADRAGVHTRVGFQYLANPMIYLARELIRDGELGEIRYFRGRHAEDYHQDAALPWYWRFDPSGGGGAVADIGSHIIAMARYLLGPIDSVLGTTDTVIPERPAPSNPTGAAAVAVDDVGYAALHFRRGCSGVIDANWLAGGRKMQLEFEIGGSQGTIYFTQERLNELQLYRTDDPHGRQGFRTIQAGPDHPPYEQFLPAPGHQLGFNELKAIEVRDFLSEIAHGEKAEIGFAEGVEVQRVVDAIYRSATTRAWESVPRD